MEDPMTEKLSQSNVLSGQQLTSTFVPDDLSSIVSEPDCRLSRPTYPIDEHDYQLLLESHKSQAQLTPALGLAAVLCFVQVLAMWIANWKRGRTPVANSSDLLYPIAVGVIWAALFGTSWLFPTRMSKQRKELTDRIEAVFDREPTIREVRKKSR